MSMTNLLLTSANRYVRLASDDWFEQFEKKTLPLLESRRSTESRVKIAILDSGIDARHPLLLEYKDRIRAQKSWTQQSAEEDKEGHGTHAAGLILKTAPNAEIYVAKVFNVSKFFTGTAQRISDVRHQPNSNIVSG